MSRAHQPCGALLLALLLLGCVEKQDETADGSLTPDAGIRDFSCDAPANKWQFEDPGDSVKVGLGGLRANLFSIWGANATAIYAVGDEGKVIFYNGKKWASQVTPTSMRLTSVWGTSATDVWAVGYGAVVLHYDGKAWTTSSPSLNVLKTEDGGVPAGDAGAALRRNLQGVWATGATPGKTDALYAVGDDGLVLYYDGRKTTNQWSSNIPLSRTGSTSTGDASAGYRDLGALRVKDQLNGVWGASASQVFIVGDFGTILVGSYSRLYKHSVTWDTGTPKDLASVWGRSGGEVYAVGTAGTILRYAGGTTWRSADSLGKAPNQVLRGIWGPSSDNTVDYIIGWDGVLLKMSGGPSFSKGAAFDTFYCTAPGHRLEGIWGTLVPAPKGPTKVPAVWIVGASGLVLRGP